MASTYSNNLRLELIGTGDQAGTWGQTTNTNLGTLLDNAISGSVSVSVSAANTALTALDGADDQSRYMMLVLNTSTGADFAVYTPPAPKVYVARNASSYVATIYNSTVLGNTTAAGTGVAVGSGQSLLVYTDGTNFRTINAANLTGTLAVANGGTGATSLTANNVILGNGTSAVQTVAPGTDGNFLVSDGTTWTTESGATARTSLGLGSMATQNSNSVSISGGSVSGITDLAVADGGTGASTAANARTNLGLGTLATQSPTGTPSSSTFLRGDNTWSAPPSVDTSSVLTATAGASVGAVGTYAFLAVVSPSTSYTPGQTAAGSGLDYVSANSTNYPGTSPSGTWRCMGYAFHASSGEVSNQYGTVWLRIS